MWASGKTMRQSLKKASILSKDEVRQNSIPKPVIDKLCNPDTINFVIKDEMVHLEGIPKKNNKIK
jgi:hypothetical protein